MSEAIWAEAHANELAAMIQTDVRAAVTWLNHYTVRRATAANLNLSGFRHVGVDGTLLRMILGKPLPPRTSADLVLPLLLGRVPNLRVGLIGGTEEAIAAAREAVSRILAPGSAVVLASGGYGMVRVPDGAERLDLLIVGMGAPRQDLFAIEASQSRNPPRLTVTCGGWLDQISQRDYYPSWAYKFKLNWLIRVLREPKRLWKRYTVDAWMALIATHSLKAYVLDSAGYKRYVADVAGGGLQWD